MADEAGDKSQEATPHRRKQAREDGQIAKSQDLGSAVILVCGVGVLMYYGASVVNVIVGLMKRQLGGDAWVSIDSEFMMLQWNDLVATVGYAMLPIFGMLMFFAVLSQVLQVGLIFLPNKLMPEWSRISIPKGLKRMFSLSSVVRLAFGIGKILIVAGVAFWSVVDEREKMLGLISLDLPQIGAYMVEILTWTAMKIGVALLIMALLDYWYQKWKQEQDLKMTTQEVREEMKNLQGDPQVAARRKAVQRQLVLNRLSSAVPKADVVITNPTHLAVAIQYDPETMLAPIIVAKGAGIIAQKIRRLAIENGIPVVEKKPLAQALYRDVDVNHPVPNQQFAAVAEVLAYVYQLKGKTIPNPNAAA